MTTREVVVLERGRDAGREHQHAGDLHQREQPVDHVVGVVRGGEPGEVHPGPPDGEEHHQVVAERGGDVVLGDAVGQLGRDGRDADHEAEVEQQLQRGGGPVRLVGIAAGERAAPGHADGSGHPRSLSAVPQDADLRRRRDRRRRARARAVGPPARVAAGAGQPQPQAPPQQPPARGGAATAAGAPVSATVDSSLTVSACPCGHGAGRLGLRHRPGHLEGALAVAAPVLVARHGSTIRPGSPDGPRATAAIRGSGPRRVPERATSRSRAGYQSIGSPVGRCCRIVRAVRPRGECVR